MQTQPCTMLLMMLAGGIDTLLNLRFYQALVVVLVMLTFIGLKTERCGLLGT